jgi:hypothetical protein
MVLAGSVLQVALIVLVCMWGFQLVVIQSFFIKALGAVTSCSSEYLYRLKFKKITTPGVESF